MLGRYHHGVVERANATAAKPRAAAYIAEWREQLPWGLPAVATVAICWALGLAGLDSLYVSVPLVFVTLCGFTYVWIMYARARGRPSRE